MNKICKAVPAVVLAAGLLSLPVQVSALEAAELVPVGDTVGIEIRMDGVMVAHTGEVQTADGSCTPAEDAGILAGDIVLELCGRTTTSAADFLSAAADMDGSPVPLTVRRGDKTVRFTVTPAKTAEGTYQLGLWLRDGVSGIGTVTFYDPQSGTYGALGHGINDIESGSLMPVDSGSILDAEVVDIVKGAEGSPGELCGRYEKTKVLGSLDSNTICGIFGKAGDGCFSCDGALPVASSSEVVLGAATILSNITGNEIKEYSVEISRIYRGDKDPRSMMLTVTDPELLSLTGGIVQGMSGSPIIQNGKIIGAVTHVLVNSPDTGYGIFIENMLGAAG